MKLYDLPRAPHPRKVNIFITEKGLDSVIEKIPVDLGQKENLHQPYLAINNRGLVPLLELDDGTRLDESLAICRYLDEIYPETPLFGTNSVERALITMWERRMEFDGFLAGVEAFRNTFPPFANRGVSGVAEEFEQIPALAERGRRRMGIFFERLNKRLGESKHVGGETFSMADITAVVSVDFASRVDLVVPEAHTHTLEWYERMYERESVKSSWVE